MANHTVAGMYFEGSEATAKNNLITENTIGIRAALSSSTPTLSYNNAWGNQTNYLAENTGVITIDSGSISLNPLFDATAPGEFLLSSSSPCIDAGDPFETLNDLDGTRNDMGYTGGPCGAASSSTSVTAGFLWTTVGATPVSEIDQTSGPKRGMVELNDRPFGGRPWLFGVFGSEETDVHRYAVKVAKWTDNTPPPASAFQYATDPLNKVRYSFADPSIQENLFLGPSELNGKPTYKLTVNDGGFAWANENLRIKLDTMIRENGMYSIRMEALDTTGNPITLSPGNDLVLFTNNTWPEVEIHRVTVGGADVPACGIIRLPNATAPIGFTYTARHPEGFLWDYNLEVLVGSNKKAGFIVAEKYSDNVTPNAIWSGATNRTSFGPPSANPWTSCAYQLKLTATSRATNGYGHLFRRTFVENYAIDLGGPCLGNGPDLDGDGDVDGDDLAIFAASLGTPSISIDQ